MTAPSAARRLLPAVHRDGLRLCHPRTGVPLRSLVVADVRLDDGSVEVLSSTTPFEQAPEGVHAVGWLHGVPVGEATFVGDPAELLPQLAERLAERLGDAVLDHLLLDAASTAGGLAAAGRDGLRSVAHPAPRPASDLTISVAVCTRDRPQDLELCLRALALLDVPVHEVLVVDNASGDDRTAQVVAAHPGVRYVREPRPGLDWARNRALLEASGEVVAFVDDDVLVHRSWAAGLYAAFHDEPTALGVTGLVLPAELATPAQVLFEVAGGFGRGYRRRWFAAAVDAGEIASRVFGGTGIAGTGANMAFRRRLLLELGGFDPALDVGTVTGGGGDLEAFYRVVASGGLLVYEPSAVVRHRHRRSLPELERQMRGNGSGSYSFWLGAGRRYDARQARGFVALARHWAIRWHLSRLVTGRLAPELGQQRLAVSETKGALAVVWGRLYSRAQAEAARLAAEPGPSAPPLVRAKSRPPTAVGPDPVVVLTVPGEDGTLVPDKPVPPAAPRGLRVVVARDGAPAAAFAVGTHGAGASPSRLVREAVQALGPALLQPGHPRGLLGPVVDTATGPAELVRSGPDEQEPDVQAARQAALVSRLLTSGVPAALSPRPGLATTVLICTRGRPDLLPVALATLARQTCPPDQVVVVDNNDDPAATHQACAGTGVVVVHEPRAGLSVARNAGLPHVTGDVLVFTDDDVQAPDDWLERLVAPFADAEVDLVTGNVLPDNLDNAWAQHFEDYAGLGRGPHRRVYDQAWLSASRAAAPTWIIGATANAAVRMSSLRRVGARFEETLGPGAPSGVGEDTELFYRVLHRGGRIQYEPTAVVLHRHRADRRALSRQLFAYSKGHVAYHLEVRRLHGDSRGLRRLALSIPRAHLFRARRRHDTAYPSSLLAVEIAGHLAGPWAWLRARRAAGGRS